MTLLSPTAKILVRIPERAELEERQFVLELERIKGRAAYLGPDDLGVMYGLLLGDIESNESSQAVTVSQLSARCLFFCRPTVSMLSYCFSSMGCGIQLRTHGPVV